MALLLGISGKAGSGKDTLAQFILTELYERSGSYRIGRKKMFAGALKGIVCTITGCTMRELADPEFKKRILPQHLVPVIAREPPTYRWFMQWLGTDVFRNTFSSAVWIDTLFNTWNTAEDWIITDVRFPNEVEAIFKRGGAVLRIERDGLSTGTHPSETALDDYAWHKDFRILNNGSLEDLQNVAKQLVTLHKL